MENSKLNAFPVILQNGLSHDSHVEIGLTKREHFAGLAMQGLMVQAIQGGHNQNNIQNNEECAMFAVNMADALLNQLEK